MFEKYFIDSLVCGNVSDSIPIGMSNIGGCISIEANYCDSYNAILFDNGREYIDINNPNRVINVIEHLHEYMPTISDNGHLYILNESTLIRYRDVLDANKYDKKVLMRLPFNNVKYFK